MFDFLLHLGLSEQAFLASCIAISVLVPLAIAYSLFVIGFATLRSVFLGKGFFSSAAFIITNL